MQVEEAKDGAGENKESGGHVEVMYTGETRQRSEVGNAGSKDQGGKD